MTVRKSERREARRFQRAADNRYERQATARKVTCWKRYRASQWKGA
jgi:hypothetical protein